MNIFKMLDLLVLVNFFILVISFCEVLFIIGIIFFSLFVVNVGVIVVWMCFYLLFFVWNSFEFNGGFGLMKVGWFGNL